MNFEIYFSIRFISELNDKSSKGKMSFVQFHSVNVKGNWAPLAEKNSWPVAEITAIFRLPGKCFNCIVIKTF